MPYKDPAEQRAKDRERYPRRKEYIRRRGKLNYQRVYAEIILPAKAVPCVDCGNSFPACAMDLDHIDPSLKSFSFSGNLNRSREAVIAEVAKCVARCSNCHRIRTHEKGHNSFRLIKSTDPQGRLFG